MGEEELVQNRVVEELGKNIQMNCNWGNIN